MRIGKLTGEHSMDLETEGKRATEMLQGKVVEKITRHRVREMCVEFTDGTRLYVDCNDDGVELSITDGPAYQGE
jgi:hypothetical protein